MENVQSWGEMTLQFAIAIHMLAILIVNITDTPDDDGIPGKIYKVVEILGGVFGDRAKQLPGEADIL